MARAELVRALQCNALGVPLFAGVVMLPPFAVWAGVRKRAFFETCAGIRARRVCLVFTSLAVLQWVVRVACLLLG
jgi:hypothetical protein